MLVFLFLGGGVCVRVSVHRGSRKLIIRACPGFQGSSGRPGIPEKVPGKGLVGCRGPATAFLFPSGSKFVSIVSSFFFFSSLLLKMGLGPSEGQQYLDRAL